MEPTTGIRQRRSYETNDSTKWPKERAPKLSILKTSQALFGKELTEPEFAFWTGVLDDCSVNELRYAFDNWNRNGRYFPKPKDILELAEVYRQSAKQQYGHPTCDALCKARHNQGYSGEDMVWLFARYLTVRSSVSRTLTDGEINKLLDELDQKRGVVPLWRANV